ncbi:isoprenylcysteine carboxylmethyltransferase family protein [Arsukibacterium sp.]|uniref:methyltransferase family protein n=1 Tax=Arsukibacterium sp. TaxID=1977258 RepID=UPI00299DA41A|nr:isoprenylcysteine carboxylmethyltransferase family protein [Arsukibacterium sp.]MDX1537293.1 isoprenylcysteine carboxylmethyltransferase family protein [Arsukibacterium sp.]
MQTLELRIPPVVLVALFAAAMWLLAQWLPPLALPALWGQVVAIVLAGAGIAVAFAGVLAFRRADTTVDPRVPQQTSSLVIKGIYRYSRNPMYLGFLLLLTALAFYLTNVAALAMLPLFVLYMNRLQIVPEERYLQEKFGAEYQVYSKQVRRWF